MRQLLITLGAVVLVAELLAAPSPTPTASAHLRDPLVGLSPTPKSIRLLHASPPSSFEFGQGPIALGAVFYLTFDPQGNVTDVSVVTPFEKPHDNKVTMEAMRRWKATPSEHGFVASVHWMDDEFYWFVYKPTPQEEENARRFDEIMKKAKSEESK